MANTGKIATIQGNVVTDSNIDLSTKADLVNGLVPSSQLPSYVDDVLEYANLAGLPVSGETGKIYVTLDTNKIYRWSGSAYVEVSPTVGTVWGGIGGTLSNQTDLQSALNAKTPTTRTITINGTSYDLSADRSWTINSMVYPPMGIPVSTGSGWSTSIVDYSSSWNTAYGWGNHATVGYLTSAAAASTYQPLDADLTSIAGLAGTSGFLKKTAANTWSLDTNTYITGNQTITLSGDASGSGTTAITVTLANSGATAGSYGSATAVPVITVDAKGRITAISTSSISGALTFTGDVTGSGTTGTSTTLTLANSGVTAGTYTKVTVDAKGRVTTGTTLSAGDIPSLSATYLPLTGGTLTGNLSGTTASFSSTVTINNSSLWGLLELKGSSTTQGGQVDFYGSTVRYAAISGEYQSLNNGQIFIRTLRAGTLTTVVNLLSTGQVNIPAYTSSTSFTGTAVAILGVDASGNIITQSTSAGGGTSLNGTGFVVMSGTTVSYLTGTSSQFVKANGTLDSNTYLTSYTETDTLSTVLTRGNTSSLGATFGTAANSLYTGPNGFVRINTNTAGGDSRNTQSTALLLTNYASDIGVDGTVDIDFVTVDGNSLVGAYPHVRIGYTGAYNDLINSSPDGEARGYFRIAVRDAGSAGVLYDRFLITYDGTVRLHKYTTNGFVKFSNSDGTLVVDSTSYLPLSGGSLTGPLTITGNGAYLGDYGYNTLVLQDSSGYSGIAYKSGNNVWLHRRNGGDGSFEFVYSTNASAQGTGTYTPQGRWTASGDLYVRGQIYVGGNGSSTGTQLVYNSGTWGINITGTASNITAYTINQNLGTGNGPTFADVYTNGWLRNNNINQGLYNQSSATHFYATSDGYWNMAAGARANGGLVLRTDHQSTIKAYVYWDANGSGLLSNTGNWGVRMNYDGGASPGGQLYGSWTSNGDHRAPIFYDSNNTSYYVDPASNTYLNSLSVVDGNLELYKAQTVDMSNTATYSTSNYYPVTIPISTEIMTISIQNNLNSNVPSWSTHSGGFTLNLRWMAAGSGWGTTEIKRTVLQYHERFANQTICGGITQMGNSSQEVVWLRGGGTYYFKFSRNVSATAQSGTYTASSQTVAPTTSAQNSVWDSVSGTQSTYLNYLYAVNNIQAPLFYDYNNTAYYVDPASGAIINKLTLGTTTATDVTLGIGGNTHIVGTNYLYMGGTMGSVGSWGSREYTSSGTRYINANSFYVDNTGYGTTWSFQVNSSGNTIASVDMRSPIFYDNNNTGYYVDPASISRLNGLGVGESYYNHTYPGIVQSGSTSYNYNWYNGSWSSSVTLGYLANCSDEWEFGIHDSGHRVVSAFFFQGASTNRILMGRDIGWGTTYIEAAASFRAPIFYDSNNTGYYVDPNGSSMLSTVQMDGTLKMYGGSYYGTIRFGTVDYWACGISQRDAGNAEMRIWAKGGSAGSIYFATGFDGEVSANTLPTDGMVLKGNSLGIGNFGAAATYPSYKFHLKGTGYSDTDFRAPIFYDSNDTGYYVDPNSTSITNVVKANYFCGINGNGYGQYKGYDNNNHFIMIRGRVTGNTTTPTYTGYHRTSLVEYAESNDDTGWFFQTAATGNYDIVARITRSYSQFESSARAPLFYDSNDTSYYYDGASGTNIQYLNVNGTWGSSPFGSGHAQLNVTGTYASITQRSTQGALAYVLHHVDDRYSMYVGRGATNGTSWDWTLRAYPTQDGAYVEFNTSARAPLFYDNNNTGYYVDPASTSNMYTITAANNITAGNYLYAGYNIRVGEIVGYGGLYRSSGDMMFYTEGSGIWRFRIANVEKMLIGTDGNIWMSWANAYISTLLDNRVSKNTWHGNSYFGTGGDNYGTIWYDTNNTAYYSDPASTTVLNALTCVSLTETSSARYKENIVDLHNSLDKVVNMRGVAYNRKGSSDIEIGVIAEEVAEIVPEIVNFTKDGKADSVSYGRITAVLVEAVKEQQKQIDKQQKQIEDLIKLLNNK